MDDFDLEQFLDNVGVEMAPAGINAGTATFQPGDSKLSKGQFIDFENEYVVLDDKKQCIDESKWRNKQIYKPYSLLKTKTQYPLVFRTKSDGSLWETTEKFEESEMSLPIGSIFHLLDEGLIETGKTWFSKIINGCSQGRTIESRYIKGLAFIDNFNNEGRSKPVSFFIIFERNVDKDFCDHFLFETLVEGSGRRRRLQKIDYSDVLRMEKPITSI